MIMLCELLAKLEGLYEKNLEVTQTRDSEATPNTPHPGYADAETNRD
jgi:hypothetical protein